jgi:DNA-binding MarR family transcriptional regulator
LNSSTTTNRCTPALDLTRALDNIGLVKQCNSHDGPAAWLADGGREAVTKIRAHRSDPANRAAAARKAVLAHTYEAKLNRNEHPDAASAATCTRGHGEFLADPLSRAEILAAVDYLEQKGLLTVGIRNADGKAQWVSITASGEDCMEQHEGDVSEYLRQQRAAAATYNNNIGSISGGSGIQIGNVQATQHVNVGLDPAALREFVDMLRPQLGQFGDAEPEARAALDEVAEEAKSARPNQGRVVKALTKVAEMAVPVGARLVAEVVKYKLQEWGVLPPPASLPPAS